MKKTILIITLMLFFSGSCFSAEFEGAKWGETKEEAAAKLNEKGKLFKFTSFGEIKYNDTMFGYPCEVLLNFDGAHGLTNLYLAASGSIATVTGIENKMVAMLKAKYGEPTSIKKNNAKKYSTVTYKWFENGSNSKYPDIRAHVTKRTDGTGAVFLEYADALCLEKRDKKRAGIAG